MTRAETGNYCNFFGLKYIGPVLTKSCTHLTQCHEGKFRCFHIVYNWPTPSYSQVLNSEKWEGYLLMH